jgi:hypothetical protein
MQAEMQAPYEQLLRCCNMPVDGPDFNNVPLQESPNQHQGIYDLKFSCFHIASCMFGAGCMHKQVALER